MIYNTFILDDTGEIDDTMDQFKSLDKLQLKLEQLQESYQ